MHPSVRHGPINFIRKRIYERGANGLITRTIHRLSTHISRLRVTIIKNNIKGQFCYDCLISKNKISYNINSKVEFYCD